MLLNDLAHISGFAAAIRAKLLSLHNLIYFLDFTSAASLFDVFKVGRGVVIVNIRAKTPHCNHFLRDGICPVQWQWF
jgi:hypothetical protein